MATKKSTAPKVSAKATETIASAKAVTTKPTLKDVDKGGVVAYTDPKTNKTTYYTENVNGKLYASAKPTDIAAVLDNYDSLSNKAAGKVAVSAKSVETKPKAADVQKGQVVTYTDPKSGAVTYYTKNSSGKLAASTDVRKIISAVDGYYNATEKVQKTQLVRSQSRELNELQQELKASGIPSNKIKSIVNKEVADNKSEVSNLNKLLNADGLQYAKRDETGNLALSVDKEGNSAPVRDFLSTKLTYSDPVIAPRVQKNLDDANKFIEDFKRGYNIKGDVTSSGKTKIGMDENAIYKAYDKGLLKYNPETKKFSIDSTVKKADYSKVGKQYITGYQDVVTPNSNPMAGNKTTSKPTYITANLKATPDGITYKPVISQTLDPWTQKVTVKYGKEVKVSAEDIQKMWAYNPDDGLYYPPGSKFTEQKVDYANQFINIGGKGFQRQMSDIMRRGTVVGDKAYTKKSGNKTFITDKNGKVIGDALVNTGEEDWNGNKIYKQTSRSDTKYNKVTVESLYMQDKDTGDIIYLGSPGMGYLHIKKKSGGMFGGGFGGFVGSVLGGLALSAVLGPGGFGLSTGLANVASSAVMSAINGGDFGDVLKSALTAAVSSGLQDKFASGTMDASTTAGAINTVADDIASSLKNVIGELSPTDSTAINSLAKSLVGNALASGGDLSKAVEMTIGGAAANVVGNQVMKTTGDANLATTAVNTIKTAVNTGDVTTGLGAGLGTYVAGEVTKATDSPTAGAIAGTTAGTIATGGDLQNALLNTGINVAGSNLSGTLPQDVIQAGQTIASGYVNQPQQPSGGLPTTTETPATLAPVTGTAAPGASLINTLTPAPTKVDVSTLTPYTGPVGGLTSTVTGGTTPSSTTGGLTPYTGTLPTTGGLTQTVTGGTAPTKIDISKLTPYTGTLPAGVSPIQTTPSTTAPTTPTTVDVSKLTPITDLSLLPASLRPATQTTTAPLSSTTQQTTAPLSQTTVGT